MNHFQTQVSGKWILAGEHAVLRGSPALAFPLESKNMNFKFTADAPEFHASIDGEQSEDVKLLFWGVLEKALEKLKLNRHDIKGTLHISNNLTIGAGLGASATLCVGLTKFFIHLGVLQNTEAYEFARNLENLFHGESSGVDIAVALYGKPIRFMRGGEQRIFSPLWKPKWYLSYSGQRGITSECVNIVKQLHVASPERAQKIDERMKKSVSLAETALLSTEETGLEFLKEALDLSYLCFEEWGLITDKLHTHIEWIEKLGATAVKPTGSGGGGYVLSLWENSPPLDQLNCFIKI